MSVVLPCCRAGFAPRRVSLAAAEQRGERAGVDDTGDAQRAPEGAPTLRQCEAGRVGMQMRSPPQPDARRIRLDDDRLAIAHDRDDSQQLGGLSTFPATHTGAYRSRAAYHYESLPRRLDGSRAMVASSTGR
jgi:hypothetical protein